MARKAAGKSSTYDRELFAPVAPPPGVIDALYPPAADVAPMEQSAPAEVHGAKVWIVAEARRMKAAGEIPPDIRITALSRALACRMQKAAEKDRSIRPVGWRHIKNMLPDWGLWPVSRIK
jgi:hypothetical protein